MAIPGVVITPYNPTISSTTHSVSVACKSITVSKHNPVVYQGLKLNTQSCIFTHQGESRVFLVR